MYKINVLMSTYNGELHLREQIESIMEQKDVDVMLTIRDDGSSDGTVDVIRDNIKKYGKRIKLYTGHNIGYRKSFRRLLKYASKANYYAFADQDDVWMDEKLINAVRLIERECQDDEVCLYASSDIVTDEKLNPVGIHDISNMHKSIQGYYSRARLAGCTYVFSPACMDIARRFADVNFPRTADPDHDFIIGSIALSCGRLVLDSNAYIYHRRTNHSVTSGGNGFSQRVKVEYDLTFKRKGMHYVMAETSLRVLGDKLSDEAEAFFKDVINYKKSFKNQLKLLTNSDMKSGVKLGDIETKLKILLNIY